MTMDRQKMLAEKLASLRATDEIIDVEAEPVITPTVTQSAPAEGAKKKSRVQPRKSALLEVSEPVIEVSDEQVRTKDEFTAVIDRPVSSSLRGNPFARQKKLDKKKQAELERKWSATEAGTVRGAGFQSIAKALASKIGDEAVYSSDEDFARLYYGIPVASIAFEWLLGNDVLPLGLPIMLAGAWGTGKSALLYEMFRWTCLSNGLAHLIDTELKADDTMLEALVDRKKNEAFFLMSQAKTVELAQETLLFMSAEVKKLMEGTKEVPGPGRVFPYLIGLDSYAGAPAQEQAGKVINQGYAARGYSELALSYSRFLPVFISEMAHWPFGLVVINHLTEGTKEDGSGIKVYKTKGGTSVNFREGLEFHLFRRSAIRTAKFSGIEVEIRNAKNSFGPTGKRMLARFLSWVIDDPVTGLPVTKVMWDWHFSLVKLLPSLEGDAKKRLLERGVNLIVDPKSLVNTPRVRMPALGMGVGEYLPYAEFGALLLSQPQVCDLLRDALNIKRRYPVIGPGPDVTQGLLQGTSFDGEE